MIAYFSWVKSKPSAMGFTSIPEVVESSQILESKVTLEISKTSIRCLRRGDSNNYIVDIDKKIHSNRSLLIDK
jgi:hypothetical protein